jgi:hypothetical protein
LILLYADRHFKHKTMRASFKYASASQMMRMINDYFVFVKGELQPASSTETTKLNQRWLREPTVPTLRGLAVFLEFKSIDELERYEKKLNYRKSLRYARLKIEAAYEQMLFEKPTGAIFALKNMGRNDNAATNQAGTANTLKIEITNSGPPPACSEKEVAI